MLSLPCKQDRCTKETNTWAIESDRNFFNTSARSYIIILFIPIHMRAQYKTMLKSK